MPSGRGRRPSRREERQRDHAASSRRSVMREPAASAHCDERLERGEQSILLLNRRGYASFVQCGDCGDVVVVSRTAASRSRITARPNGSSATTACTRSSARDSLCALRWQDAPPARARHATGRAPARRAVPGGAHRADGRGHHERKMGARGDSRPRGARRGRHSARHADDREGARLSERDAGGRRRCGRRDQPAGFSRVGAELSAPQPGSRARGARAEGRAVLIQTRVPTHHAVRCAVTHDYAAFVAEEIPARRTPVYPPHTRLANVVFSGLAEEPAANARDRGGGLAAAIDRQRAGFAGHRGRRRAVSHRPHQAAVAMAFPAQVRSCRLADEGRALFPGAVRGACRARHEGGDRSGSGFTPIELLAACCVLRALGCWE